MLNKSWQQRALFVRVTILLFLLLFAGACASSPAAAPAESDTESATAPAEAASSSLFPLTITDAVGQEFTFDSPPKLDCWWTGCSEILAELGVAAHASGTWLEEGFDSQFYFPAGAPEFVLDDALNPELWAAAEVDLLVTRRF